MDSNDFTNVAPADEALVAQIMAPKYTVPTESFAGILVATVKETMEGMENGDLDGHKPGYAVDAIQKDTMYLLSLTLTQFDVVRMHLLTMDQTTKVKDWLDAIDPEIFPAVRSLSLALSYDLNQSIKLFPNQSELAVDLTDARTRQKCVLSSVYAVMNEVLQTDNPNLATEVTKELKLLNFIVKTHPRSSTAVPELAHYTEYQYQRRKASTYNVGLKTLIYDLKGIKVRPPGYPFTGWSGDGSSEPKSASTIGVHQDSEVLTLPSGGSLESNGSRDNDFISSKARNPKSKGTKLSTQLATTQDAEDWGLFDDDAASGMGGSPGDPSSSVPM